MVKRIVVYCIIFILLLISVGCNSVDTTDTKQPDFEPHLFNDGSDALPLRITYFDDISGEEKLVFENHKYNDLVSVTDSVLAKIDLIDGIKCVSCMNLNDIVIIELGPAFALLDNDVKFVIASSLARTICDMDISKYLVIYSDGELVELKNLNIRLMPIQLSNDITPKQLENEYLNYDIMLANNDDFTLPFLVWKNIDDVFIANIYYLPIYNDIISSLTNTLFVNDLYSGYTDPSIVLDSPKITADEIIVDANASISFNADIDAILRTYKQLNNEYILRLRKYTDDSDDEYVDTVFRQSSRDYGILTDYYIPGSVDNTVNRVSIKVINDDLCYSLAKFTIEQGIKYFGLLENNETETFIYDAWFTNNEVVISISNRFVDVLAELPALKQRQFIYSIVNTVSNHFGTDMIRFLLDGYTVKSMGVINTELPLRSIV